MSESETDIWEENSVQSEGFSSDNISDSEEESNEEEPVDDGVEEVRGAEPYRFEPLARRDDRPEGDAIDNDNNAENERVHLEDDQADRLENTNWCSCGNCVVMEFVENCKCCKEIDAMTEKIVHTGMDPDAIPCFTEHPWYEATCLNPGTLETAYYQYRQQYGARAVEGDMARKYRHVSYRQVIRWCWGYLGRHNRIPLPSCVMQKARTTYPDPDGNYQGFRYPDLDE